MFLTSLIYGKLCCICYNYYNFLKYLQTKILMMFYLFPFLMKFWHKKSLRVPALMVKYKLVCSHPLAYLSRNALNSVTRVPSLKASRTRFQELKKCKQPDLCSGHITLPKNNCLQKYLGGGGGRFHISGPWYKIKTYYYYFKYIWAGALG